MQLLLLLIQIKNPSVVESRNFLEGAIVQLKIFKEDHKLTWERLHLIITAIAPIKPFDTLIKLPISYAKESGQSKQNQVNI